MNAARRRDELKRFLHARRAALTPEAVGLHTTGRRRTPGLRREEVAMLSSVGVTWYTWLEQGREINVSHETLARIAKALRLSESDTSYLFALADVELPGARLDDTKIDPRIQLVLDGMEAYPAFIINVRWDVVAFNRLADLVYEFDDFEGPFARNHIWRACIDPRRRRLYVDWTKLFAMSVGTLRAAYASRVGDPSFDALVRELQRSPEFVRAWEAHYTEPMAGVAPLRLQSDTLGRLSTHSARFFFADGHEHVLFALPPADARTAAVFAEARNAPKTGALAPSRPTMDACTSSNVAALEARARSRRSRSS
jgi:transcriptional regulator with XRE-family HTH domain